MQALPCGTRATTIPISRVDKVENAQAPKKEGKRNPIIQSNERHIQFLLSADFTMTSLSIHISPSFSIFKPLVDRSNLLPTMFSTPPPSPLRFRGSDINIHIFRNLL